MRVDTNKYESLMQNLAMKKVVKFGLAVEKPQMRRNKITYTLT